MFTNSKSTIETLKKVKNVFKVNNKNTRTTLAGTVSWILTYFRPMFPFYTLKNIRVHCV